MPCKKQSSKPPVATNLDDANELISALWDRLNDLEDRLNQNSPNSSRPSSSNGPGASSSAPAKKPTGRKRGAQSGHKGSKRALADSVDETLTYYPDDTCASVAVPLPSAIHRIAAIRYLIFPVRPSLWLNISYIRLSVVSAAKR